MKRNDLVLLAGILLVGALLFGWMALRDKEKEGAFAVVTVNGKEYGRYVLAADQTVDIPGPLGTNRLVIAEGTAWMEAAVCPDHYCMKQGEISKTGQQIICLPNRIVVEIVGGESLELDATVY